MRCVRLSGPLLALFLLTVPGGVRSQVAVIDGANLAQNTISAIELVVAVAQRVTIIAHFRGMERRATDGPTVVIEDHAFIGPGVIILPNVTIGEGTIGVDGGAATDAATDRGRRRISPRRGLRRAVSLGGTEDRVLGPAQGRPGGLRG